MENVFARLLIPSKFNHNSLNSCVLHLPNANPLTANLKTTVPQAHAFAEMDLPKPLQSSIVNPRSPVSAVSKFSKSLSMELPHQPVVLPIQVSVQLLENAFAIPLLRFITKQEY